MGQDVRSGVTAARRLAEGAALRDVVDTDDPAAWLGLDEGARAEDWSCPPYVVPAWEETEGGRRLTAVLRGGERLTESQLALALCHRDGRIRHRALGLVAGRPALLPLVVLRCADWAPPVRERARTRLTEAPARQPCTRQVAAIQDGHASRTPLTPSEHRESLPVPESIPASSRRWPGAHWTVGTSA